MPRTALIAVVCATACHTTAPATTPAPVVPPAPPPADPAVTRTPREIPWDHGVYVAYDETTLVPRGEERFQVTQTAAG